MGKTQVIVVIEVGHRTYDLVDGLFGEHDIQLFNETSEAIAWLTSADHSCDALIIDLARPQINGALLAQLMGTKHPGLTNKTILCSLPSQVTDDIVGIISKDRILQFPINAQKVQEQLNTILK